ncbi:MAG: contractile injection system tape measure protein [Azospirillaceae bacterium]|nr:contractile injection system tape measure protein [Azospirillaceae bacterium]
MGETLSVDNAGLVLVGPFLPLFFSRLDLLSEGPDGVPRIEGAAASRAVHLLQYVVDLRCDRPDVDLALNKVLCGLAPSTPVEPFIIPTEAEMDMCAHMTQAILDAWTIIKSTSPEGLRETFLQRSGHLASTTDAGWMLVVRRHTLDLLVDQIPWNFRLVFQRWMTSPLNITW